MRVPLRWLEDYVEINLSVEELAERLTLAGLEVSAIERIGDWWDRERIVVGEVVEVGPHPDADRLVLVDVNYGGDELEKCVTGAPNLFSYLNQGPVSLKVAFAMEGAELYDGHKEGFVKTRLKKTKIRGVPSRAMVCSEKELGISEEHEGIMFLSHDAPVGVPLIEYLGDVVLDLDLTPNLARCFSMIGVAREVAALTGASLRLPSIEWLAKGPPAADLVRIEIEAPELCNRYLGTIIRDVEIGPSPQWMQDRIRRAGMRPISSIVDVTNYVMLEWGQPLHAFDYDKLVARANGSVPTIIVRRAEPGETMMTLDGAVRTLTQETLLITDTAGPIAVAGVMGGFETEIDLTTKNILLEAANFDLVSIRRTTQELKLPSEASLRFGKGIHSSMPGPAARRATELMRILAGGTIAQGVVDAYPVEPEAVIIELDMADVKRSLGIELGVEEVAGILRSLEFMCESRSAGVVRVTVPDHRLDCKYPADLIEEVARIYGYDRIPVAELADQLPPQRTNRDLQLEQQVRDVLAGSGLQEIVTYALTDTAREAAVDPFVGADDLSLEEYVVVTNPISRDRSIMRRSLLPGGLDTVASNQRFRDHVAVFEIGKVFLLEPGEELPKEPRHLAVVMTGPRHARHWQAKSDSALGYYDLKGILETLLDRLQIGPAQYEVCEHPSYQKGRAASLAIQGPGGEAVTVGTLGELAPEVKQAFGLPATPVAAAELDLEALLSCVAPVWYIEPITPYPAVLQDLALVVDETVPAAQVEDAICKAGGFLLKRVELFDVYRGEPVAEGKKSLAFALTFQAPDKTLRDAIVAKQVTRIVKTLNEQLGAELRA